jgi:hypothetical protein
MARPARSSILSRTVVNQSRRLIITTLKYLATRFINLQALGMEILGPMRRDI